VADAGADDSSWRCPRGLRSALPTIPSATSSSIISLKWTSNHLAWNLTSEPRTPRALWRDIERAFGSGDPEYDKLIASLAEYAGISPNEAPPHSATKLRRLWMDLAALHSTALTHSKQSGTHDSDFFEFCGERIVVPCIHDWLLPCPKQLASVEAKLPNERDCRH
jgi:hypothetical protein